MEAPPLIPDDRADKVLDQCPTFESRRAAAKWRNSELGAVVVIVLLAVAAAVLI